ncbi:MAG TPA: hypothetical protein VN048_18020 [Verrucomicrobiae bacterium]|jgi:hypothetical protein|nr:hypothetical protein [Verrucomicrobiae bacterium]
MSGRTKQRARKLFRIDLDNEIIALPGRGLKSVLGLFAHLENLAKRTEADAAPALKGIGPAKAFPVVSVDPTAAAQMAERVSFRELGRQVVRAAHCQVRALQERLEAVQSLVLINDWAVAERLWAKLAPDCKTPLFEMGFIEELWGISADQLQVGGWSLTRQWQQFVLIQAEVEVLLGRRRSLVELSDMLERDLGRWLVKFVDLLEKLDEESAA